MPTSELQDAIHKLEEFSRKTSQQCTASRLQKTIALFKSLIIDKKRRHDHSLEDHQEVLKAIEIVNRERFFIQKLKLGNPAERKLADSFTQAIEAYNHCRDHQAKNAAAKDKRLVKFSIKNTSPLAFALPKIDLPQQITVAYHYPQQPLSDVHPRQISAIQADSSSVKLSRQSVELFHMKALSLLERYGIASNPEARIIVKTSPILTNMDNELKCTLAQTLTLFPGQTVRVAGYSELDPQTQTICRLFPETFSICLESTQTGFPYPSQRAGWTLANQLIPSSPQRMDLLGTLASFYQRKKKATADLLPQGNLIGKAKKLLKLKKQVFETNKKELIGLHQELALSILEKGPAASIPVGASEIISKYFELLQLVAAPFDWLAETHQMIRDVFIAQPHQAFLETALKKKSENLSMNDSLTTYQEATSLYDHLLADARNAFLTSFPPKILHEPTRIKYIECMGMTIGKAAKQIILQYLSEDLIFQPPPLDLFEKKIQAAAYQHVEDFLEELELEFTVDKGFNSDLVASLLTKELRWDIDLFQTNAGLAIPNQLAHYFDQRHRTTC